MSGYNLEQIARGRLALNGCANCRPSGSLQEWAHVATIFECRTGSAGFERVAAWCAYPETTPRASINDPSACSADKAEVFVGPQIPALAAAIRDAIARAQAGEEFRCFACGTLCDSAPLHGPAICPDCCGSHLFAYDAGERARVCQMCGTVEEPVNDLEG